MFGMSLEKVKKDIEEKINLVTDYDSLVQGRTGTKNPLAVNTLLAKFNKRNGEAVSLIVSEYVFWRLARASKGALFQALAVLAKGNHAYDGWGLQSDFLFQLTGAADHESHCFTVFTEEKSESKNAVKWAVLRVDCQEQDQIVTFPDSLQSGYWIVPERPNYPGFDAIGIEYLNGRWIVRFVNVTRAMRHSLNPDLVPALSADLSDKLRNLKINPLGKDEDVVIEVVFLSPTGVSAPQVPESHLAHAEKVLKLWKWKKESIKYLFFDRSGFPSRLSSSSSSFSSPSSSSSK
jgi:hypothetical protein